MHERQVRLETREVFTVGDLMITLQELASTYPSIVDSNIDMQGDVDAKRVIVLSRRLTDNSVVIDMRLAD